MGKFPPNHFLIRGDGTAKAQYIVDRCQRIHGMTIGEAVEKFMYKDTHGDQKHYCMADLQYDLNLKMISIVPTKPGPVTRMRTVAAAKTSHRQSTAASSTSNATRLSGSARSATSAPSSLTSAAPVAQSERPSAAVLRDMQRSIIDPLLKDGAAGVQGQMNIFTVLGVGHACGFDPLLLSTLPVALAKKASERTEFDKVVLK